MPPDPVRVADTRAWLEKAEQDLRSAQADLAFAPPIMGDAVFHCQQAVEKALKAFLTWHDRPFRYPGDASVPTPAESEAALTLASRVVQTISDRVPPEARI